MSEAIGEIFATPGEEYPFKALLKFGSASRAVDEWRAWGG
jgi:hypothetical protein